MTSFDQFLSALDLPLAEQRVLQTVADTGPILASQLATLLELPRNTVRGLLDHLVQRGLLQRTRDKNRFRYELLDFSALERKLEQRRSAINAELDGQLLLLRKAQNEFNRASASLQKPRVRVFSGTKGLRELYEDTLTAEGEIRSWGSFDANVENLPAYFERYYSRRSEKGIRMKSIHPDTALAREKKRADRREKRRSLLIPQNLFNISPEIQVYDGKVNIASWKDGVGLLIESKPIAEALRAVFDLSYQLAEKEFPS